MIGFFDSIALRADTSYNNGGFANYPPDNPYWYGDRGTSTGAGMVVDEEGARKLSAWFRGRDLLATALAMLPLQLFERLPDDKGAVIARDNPLYDVLHSKPNNWMNSFDWRRMKGYHLIDHGNAYDHVRAGRRGFADQLWPWHPKTVKRELLRSGEYAGQMLYHVRDPKTNQVTTYTADEVFDLRGASDDGVNGKGILQYARESLGLGLAVESYASRIFGKGMLSGGIIETPGKLDPEVAKRMANRFVTTPGEWAMPKVLEQGAKWIKPEMSPEDFQMILSRKTTVDDIARWLGVPRHMLENSDPSFGNAEQFNRNFETFSIGPWLSLIEFAINDQLIIANKKYYAEFNRDAFRRSDFLARWQGHQIAIQTGTFTRNEVRRIENRNAIDGLDEPLQPAHLTGNQSAPVGSDANDPPPPKKQTAGSDDADQARALAHQSAARLLRKEVRNVQKLCVQHARSAKAFAEAVTAFYAEHAQLVSESLCMSTAEAKTYCEGQAKQAIELGAAVAAKWEAPEYAAGLAAWALLESAA